MQLQGLSAIVTGASQGFGLAVAKAFVKEGANVAICARHEAALNEAKQELINLAQDKDRVIASQIDVVDPNAVDRFIKEVIVQVGHIDIVVSNAGIYGPKGAIEDIDWEEWSYAIDVNLKGSVLITRSALPYLKKQTRGKIIFLSGGGATKPLPFLSAYAASKAALVRYAETLAEELKAFHIDVNAIAPGALNTRLLDEILAAGPDKVGEYFYHQSLKQKEQGGSSLDQGAALCVYLASSQSNGVTGKLISAIWDPWQDLHLYELQLATSDIYTLRRIVPEDRGLQWNRGSLENR